jgi:hypothetical protein
MAEWTQFAGLVALDDGDPITVDGGSFLTKNPRITDHLLGVGAVTHRHDAHAAVPNPQVAASGVVASDGSLPAGTSYALTYTIVDSSGGETLPAPGLALSTGAGAGSPTIAPTVAPDYTQGIMPAGGYFYGLTYTDGLGGETTMGPSTFATLDPGYASGAVDLSGMSAELVANGGQAVTWRLWRSYEGADWHLVTEAATDTYVDTGFDPPDNPALPPAQSTTSGTNSLSITLPSAEAEPALAQATAINVYLAADSSYQDPCLYAQLAPSAAGTTFAITAATVTQGSPPHVSTSIRGAQQIDPDTELIDFPWKRPVATLSALPIAANTDGDIRETLDTHLLYTWDADTSAWATTTGETGATGPAGPRGSLWYAGTGAPGTIAGSRNQDFYVDTTTGNYYELVVGTWTLEGTIAAGQTGPAGPTGPTGLTGPTGATGATGSQGTAGSGAGSQLFFGTGAPGTIAGAVANDSYIDMASGNCYQYAEVLVSGTPLTPMLIGGDALARWNTGTASKSQAWTVASAVPAGSLVVVACAGPLTPVGAVTVADSKGNTYCGLSGGTGFAFSIITNALTINDTITLTTTAGNNLGAIAVAYSNVAGVHDVGAVGVPPVTATAAVGDLLLGVTHGGDGSWPRVATMNNVVYLDGEIAATAGSAVFAAANAAAAISFTPTISGATYALQWQLQGTIAGLGPVPSTQQAAGYTFALADAGTVVESTDASAATFTIAPHSSVAFPVGTMIEVFQYGAGQITIAAGAGVALCSDGAKARTAAQYATIGLRQRATDQWVLSGDLA